MGIVNCKSCYYSVNHKNNTWQEKKDDDIKKAIQKKEDNSQIEGAKGTDKTSTILNASKETSTKTVEIISTVNSSPIQSKRNKCINISNGNSALGQDNNYLQLPNKIHFNNELHEHLSLIMDTKLCQIPEMSEFIDDPDTNSPTSKKDKIISDYTVSNDPFNGDQIEYLRKKLFEEEILMVEMSEYIM